MCFSQVLFLISEIIVGTITQKKKNTKNRPWEVLETLQHAKMCLHTPNTLDRLYIPIEYSVRRIKEDNFKVKRKSKVCVWQLKTIWNQSPVIVIEKRKFLSVAVWLVFQFVNESVTILRSVPCVAVSAIQRDTFTSANIAVRSFHSFQTDFHAIITVLLHKLY